MEYLIVYEQKLKSGEIHSKWIPSCHYEISSDYLLASIRAETHRLDQLLIPFVLTLCAELEANLNDWIIVDTFAKHGAEHYKKLADAYCSANLTSKVRLAVAVLTDNHFRLRDESAIVQSIDKLIAARNKITHPRAYFYVQEEATTEERRIRPPVDAHPLNYLTVRECSEFHEATRSFDRLFFSQYDKGVIEENELLREIEAIGKSVPP